MGLYRPPDVLDLLHHRLVYDLTACGIHDDEVVSFVPGNLYSALRDPLRRRLRALGIDRDTQLLAYLLELVYSRRTVRIARHQVRVLAHLAHEKGELAGGRCLTVSVEACEHHDRRRARGEGELARGPAHEVRELLVDDLFDDPVVHVRLEQSQTYLPRDLLDLVLGEGAAAAHPVQGRVEPLA